MKSLRKVIWAEGMFLGQQHFQLWDRYFETYQNLQSRSISPLSWGLLDYEIDTEALENGQFRLNSAQIIFPDGRLVSYDITEDAPLAIDLKGGYSEKIDLYLSGSSARLLSREVATSMRGRAVDLMAVEGHSPSVFLPGEGVR